jgi:hypothetical protein
LQSFYLEPVADRKQNRVCLYLFLHLSPVQVDLVFKVLPRLVPDVDWVAGAFTSVGYDGTQTIDEVQVVDVRRTRINLQVVNCILEPVSAHIFRMGLLQQLCQHGLKLFHVHPCFGLALDIVPPEGLVACIVSESLILVENGSAYQLQDELVVI